MVNSVSVSKTTQEGTSLDKLVKEGKAPAKPYYALTTQQYENLSMNMAEIKRYTNNVLQIIKFYRDYDKEENAEESSQK